MSDQLIEGCAHEWAAENVFVRKSEEKDGSFIGDVIVMVLCSKCHKEKPPIDLAHITSTKRLLTDST